VRRVGLIVACICFPNFFLSCDTIARGCERDNPPRDGDEILLEPDGTQIGTVQCVKHTMTRHNSTYWDENRWRDCFIVRAQADEERAMIRKVVLYVCGRASV
jgi:hypothetical protein